MLNYPTALLNLLKIQFRDFCKPFYKAQIQSIFTNAGFRLTDEEIKFCYERVELVNAYYDSVDWNDEKTIDKFVRVIESTLLVHFVSTEQKEYLLNICKESGFEIEDSRIVSNYEVFHKNLFEFQFPAGLPFGMPKPNFSITSMKGSQKLRYQELQNGLGLLTGKIYPNFTFKMLERLYGLDGETNRGLRKSLYEMCQTKYEKEFLVNYAKKYQMVNQDIPVLIPQAWIQWNSQSKKNLRDINSSYKDELYRADFVAFWNYKRYIILVDDISHYGQKKEFKWYADEESYAKRLKEDRKLRIENWQVFRVSNWELRDNKNIQLIVEYFKELVGF
ncbi:MAG: hypothetical protein AAF063_25760 [Cyanobacteria bacterium J06643_5]